jgi:quercetin dioxygenase-like cupin family protein
MFKPNQTPFQACLTRIEKATKKIGFDPDKRIVTSRDEAAQSLRKALRTQNVPKGFEKWQLPVSLEGAVMFISVAAPNVKVPEHTHNEGAGLRFIASGSITYKDTELNAGDWMYIPKGAKYSFQVGALGATMFYCYHC